jgi:osmoprotectant transport system substrate-binding protein
MDRRQFALLLLLAGCASRASRITVGSKNFTEQLILGEMLAQALKRVSRVPVEERLYLAGTYICHQALLAGRIDVYVEYTGTALNAILKQPPGGDPAQLYRKVKDAYLRNFDLVTMPPLGFNNSFAIIMRGPEARRQAIAKLSQLEQFAPQLRMGVGYEFIERRDGYQGLVNTYGLHFAEPPRVMDLGLLYRALENRQVDVIAGANTDGLIAAFDLTVLEDDRRYFPPYDAVPIARRETLEKHPEVEIIFERLSGRITANDMRRMNYAVDGLKQDAARVAAEFLAHEHLLNGATGR